MTSKITLLFYCFVGFMMMKSNSFSEINYDKFVNSNYGTEFWFTVPPALIETGSDGSNFVRIYINSDFKGDVTLSIPGKGYTKTVKVSPGVPAEISLTPELAQPYIKTALDPVSPSEIYRNTGINISSDVPVSINVLVSYSSTSEGFTAIPVNLIGNEYIISSYGDASIYYPNYNSFPSLTGITAMNDGTEVTFILGGNSSTITSSGQKPGETLKKILNKGDVWMISSQGRNGDLSGSKILSSKPVSVVSANYSANVPISNKYSGYISEMELPTKYWGRSFHIPIIAGRKYSPIIRIYSKEANTNVNYNGNHLTTITESGGIIGTGYYEFRLNDKISPLSGLISSDKPISVTLYNTGVEEDGLPEPPGDPFQILLNPIENYLNDVNFSNPALTPTSGYESNYLCVIYEKDDKGEIPDNLKLGKFINGNYIYTPVKTMNLVHNLTIDGINNFGLATVKTDKIANYSLISDHKFTSYIYGFNKESSYGFSAGMKTILNENTDKIAPVVSWQIDCKGLVKGITKDMPDNNTKSNLAGALFLSDESTNFVKGSFDQIIPGVTSTVNWSLNVINPDKDAYAVLIFWDVAGNFTKSDIIYKAAKYNLNKNYEFFGSFSIESPAIQKEFLIINNSDTAAIIDKIELKDRNQGFEILDNFNFPILIPKNESIKVNIRFTPTISGSFSDSLGFGDACKFNYKSHIQAVVGNPVIETSDISFSDITIGGKITQNAFIHNTGVSDLIIYSYKNLTSGDLKLITEHNFDLEPLVLQPDNKFGFTVEFAPKSIAIYSDSIIFSSNAKQSDSICKITAKSVAPGLVADSYSWGKKRIFRNMFPAGPYSIENEKQSITLENTGTTDILIKGIEILEEREQEAFEFNRQIFNNLRLKPGEKYDYKVQFRPAKRGYHNLSFRYVTDFESSTTVTELSGFGTVPKIESQIINFDTTIVENYDSPSIRKIEIKNQGTEQWEYADTLYIYDFKISKSEEISEVWANFGSMGFKIDKQVIQFPIILAPGKSYNLYSAFVAPFEGVSKSDFMIISDATDTAKILITGVGVEQQISFTGGSAETCLGVEKVITGIIKNNSQKTVKFGNITFNNYKPEFKLLNNDISGGFSLEPGEHKSIEIAYTPIDLEEKKIEVIIPDAKNPLIKKTALFSGKPIQYEAKAVESIEKQSYLIGDSIKMNIALNSDINFSDAGINEIEIFIKYNQNILQYINESVKVADNLNGYFTISKDEEYKVPGISKYIMKSLGGAVINRNTDLFEIKYLLYYPNDLVDFTDVETSIIPVNNQCLSVNSAISRINIKPICGNDLRVIEFSGNKYKLNSINPNPIVDETPIISFSIGISANTVIEIYNSQGLLIESPVNGFLNSGSYEIKFDISNYNSGLYFYTIKSGPFSEVRKFVISK